MDLTEEMIRQYYAHQRALDQETSDILDQMKAEAEANYRRNRDAKRDRYDYAYNELVRLHVQHQREKGVAVPSHSEAANAAAAVMERILQEGRE